MSRSHALWGLVVALVIMPLVMLRADEPKPETPQPAAPKAESAKVEGTKPSAPKLGTNDEYYDLYEVLADTIDQVERNYVRDISRRELMEAAIQGVLAKLDPYSNYIKPEDLARFKTSVESQFGGIGIQIAPEDGRLKILSPIVGGPAYRAGLQAGDTITEIDGKPIDGINSDEAVKRLKGEVGASVTITVARYRSGKRDTVTLVREMIHVDTVLGDHRQSDDSWDFMLDHDKKIGYIRVTTFSRETPRDMKRALDQLKKEGLTGLIVDLRFDPGGLLTAAVEIADLFVTEGRIVSTEGRNAVERAWDAHADGTYAGFPMVVLVNHYSASASEIVAACLQDHRRAKIVGERTWGKGSVQNLIDLEGGKSALKLTTASYRRPSGKNIHRFPDAKESDEWGVSPDPDCNVKLNDRETRELMETRRERDVVTAKPAASGADSPAPEDPKPAPARPAVDRQLAKALEILAQPQAEAK